MEEAQKKRAKFPALGSMVRVPFFDRAPERAKDESGKALESVDAFAFRVKMYEALSDAFIEVELVDRETVIGWSHRFDLWWSTEEKRKHDLEKAGLPIPSGLTIDGAKEIQAIHFDVVSRCVAKVSIDVGGVSLDEIGDRKQIANLLNIANLLADVSRLARDAQKPTPVQAES